MRVTKPFCLGLMTRPFEMGRRFYLGASVLCFVPLGPEDALFSEMGLWKMLAEELPPEQTLDLVIPKRVAEYLVIARACAPGGTPAQAVRVSARFGAATKSLIVVGDRHLEGGRMNGPVPFTEMPLDWSHAYGGPKFAENPLGRGMAEVGIPGVGLVVPLPNIEDPAVAPEHRRFRPAGFGPIDQTWPQRARFAGTYGDRWLKEDFPGFARDMDWRFFNAAPADQHLPAPLKGTEAYAFENLHPAEPLIQGRLPGLAPRLFLVRRGDDALEEVGLGLTTVVFLPHRKRAVLIHHGIAEVAEEDARDIVQAVLGVERIGRHHPAEHYRQVRDLRMDPDLGMLHALRETDLAPADLIRPDPDVAAHSDLLKTENLLAKNGRKDSDARIAAYRAEVASHGLDPDAHGPTPLPPAQPPPSPDELPARIQAALDDARAMTARAEAERAKDTDAELAKTLEGSGLTVAMVRAEQTQRPSGPPKYRADDTRRDLRETADRVRAGGGPPEEIEEILADPVMNGIWDRSEAEQRAAYRDAAHLQDPAPRLGDRRQQRLREEVAAKRGQLAGLDLCGADLSGLDLSGADLTGAWLDAANLRGTNFTGAKLGQAVLAHAAAEGARFDRADLTGANLGRARLGGAVLDGAMLRDAVLGKADLRGASLRGADLEGANLLEALFEGAMLEGLRAKGAVLVRLSLAQCRAAGAMLADASFIECDLTGIDVARATLTGAAFLNCRVAGLRAQGADLSGAVFAGGCDLTEAQFQGAALAKANLRGAVLQRAVLTGAMLDGADFSEADLQDANLAQASARGARFVVADLRRAVLARGDFAQGILSRADLRGADLTEASFYEADLARVRADGTTRYSGMMQTRMRLRPRAEPAR
jgi:uncharacterized protein YjbI with pentapeptide repeats